MDSNIITQIAILALMTPIVVPCITIFFVNLRDSLVVYIDAYDRHKED